MRGRAIQTVFGFQKRRREKKSRIEKKEQGWKGV
jgi:hypothetical protein